MNSLYYLKFLVSEFSSSVVQEVQEIIAPVQKFWKGRWPSKADGAKTLQEIAETFRFSQHCLQHQVYTDNLQDFLRTPIQRGDTLLVSPLKSRCNPLYLEPASSQLQANFKIADSIMNYVQEKVPHSPNYQSRTIQPPSSFFRFFRLFRPEFCFKMESKVWDARIIDSGISPERGLFIDRAVGVELAQRIEKIGMGFCEDLAHVGKLFAWKEHPHTEVELAYIFKGRHVFLVIGRKEGSDPYDYRTWGENCVVCDPWSGKYYPSTAIEKELYDYLFTLSGLRDPITYPYVRHFNPKTQRVICEGPKSLKAKQAILSGYNIPASNFYG